MRPPVLVNTPVGCIPSSCIATQLPPVPADCWGLRQVSSHTDASGYEPSSALQLATSFLTACPCQAWAARLPALLGRLALGLVSKKISAPELSAHSNKVT